VRRSSGHSKKVRTAVGRQILPSGGGGQARKAFENQDQPLATLGKAKERPAGLTGGLDEVRPSGVSSPRRKLSALELIVARETAMN
jgi:hypothetical protein